MALTGLSTSPPTSFSCSTFPTFCHFLHMLGLSCLCGPVCAVAFLWNAIPLSPIWWIANDILRSNATTSSKKPAQAWPSPFMAHSWPLLCVPTVLWFFLYYSISQHFPATVHGSSLFPCLSPSELWTPASWDPGGCLCATVVDPERDVCQTAVKLALCRNFYVLPWF